MGLSRKEPFLLLLLGVSALLLGGSAGSSSHSMRYVYTSVSEPGQQEPQFFHVAYVDDQEFVSYDAQARRVLPTAPWIRKVDKDDPQYWERNSQYVWNWEQNFRVDLGTLSGYYNQSGGEPKGGREGGRACSPLADGLLPSTR
nr:PREDICTED: HLA class I histocompatibility antigen, A-34 alpha chain-like [Anolis carolinensis]|eukprot:XP_008122222.2 PREDICTED: HLA class I histocompatibility antigen, A-34 alpha chain-like [Anolis carolinensis]